MNADVKSRLQAAKDSLAGVLPQLERSEEFCGHCNRRNFKNWDEAQMAKEIEAVVRKLEGFLSKATLNLPARVGPEIDVEAESKDFTKDDHGMYESPRGYAFGSVMGKSLRHLVSWGESFNTEALCGVSLHNDSKTDTAHAGSKFCDKCIKKWRLK